LNKERKKDTALIYVVQKEEESIGKEKERIE
jgi:hypothetical protein